MFQYAAIQSAESPPSEWSPECVLCISRAHTCAPVRKYLFVGNLTLLLAFQSRGVACPSKQPIITIPLTGCMFFHAAFPKCVAERLPFSRTGQAESFKHLTCGEAQTCNPPRLGSQVTNLKQIS